MFTKRTPNVILIKLVTFDLYLDTYFKTERLSPQGDKKIQNFSRETGLFLWSVKTSQSLTCPSWALKGTSSKMAARSELPWQPKIIQFETSFSKQQILSAVLGNRVVYLFLLLNVF